MLVPSQGRERGGHRNKNLTILGRRDDQWSIYAKDCCYSSVSSSWGPLAEVSALRVDRHAISTRTCVMCVRCNIHEKSGIESVSESFRNEPMTLKGPRAGWIEGCQLFRVSSRASPGLPTAASSAQPIGPTCQEI